MEEKEDKVKCSKSTVIRTALLIVALINNCLMLCGHKIMPFSDETVMQVVSAMFTGVTSIMAWWKNNSFTEEARIADSYLKEAKNVKKK